MKKIVDYIPNPELTFFLWEGNFITVAGANLAILGNYLSECVCARSSAWRP
jgi:hypothetical protein